MPLMLTSETSDEARERIFSLFSGVSEARVFANRLLIATYQRPDKTKSGLHLADQTKAEDKYQSKVGLVMKMGPLAFVDDEKVTFTDKVKVGDWVLFKPAHGWPLDLDDPKGNCRVIEDQDVEGVVERPDAVW